MPSTALLVQAGADIVVPEMGRSGIRPYRPWEGLVVNNESSGEASPYGKADTRSAEAGLQTPENSGGAPIHLHLLPRGAKELASEVIREFFRFQEPAPRPPPSKV